MMWTVSFVADPKWSRSNGSVNLYAFWRWAVDYEYGFVRRGLAGEIMNIFPSEYYFSGLLFLRWLVSVVSIFGLVAVAWTVALRFGRSERRLMLALLVPVLPFGFARAVALPSPDLLAGAALAIFTVVVATAKADRRIVLSSAAYGICAAALTLIHEVIPLLLSLGAIMAIATLVATHRSVRVQRLSAVLAVAPGLVVALVIGMVGRRDVSSECDRLPHKIFDDQARLSTSQRMSGQHAYVDYHDWVCGHLNNYSWTLGDSARDVASHGAFPLIISMAVGMAIFAATIYIVRQVSDVPFTRLCTDLRPWRLWVVFGATLLLPVFAGGSDWVRWWVAISFDVGVVYLLYASNQPESTQPSTRRTAIVFAVATVILAFAPVGTFANLVH